jgi:hypothetical protein
MALSNVGSGQTVKFQTTIVASGAPVSWSVLAYSQIPKSISTTVNSVPQGAMLTLDGVDVGLTPKLISVGIGKQVLAFAKEGFHSGKFPLEISADDTSGGSVSYELGMSAFDTIELRDGTVLTSDLVSLSGMDIVIRAGASLQHIDRNKVKRILFVERDAPLPATTISGEPNP